MMLRSIEALESIARTAVSVGSIEPRFESPSSGLMIAKPLTSVGMPKMDPAMYTVVMLLRTCGRRAAQGRSTP